jgi:predicted ABC-type ATPase
VPARQPTIYVIAGSNGAGKTTFATEFLPHYVHCLRFLNPDEIARGLSPLQPAAANVKAARILLREIAAAIRARETFAIESTLSGRTYIQLFRRARATGYEIELHYLWLASPNEAIARVRQRVRKGGHNVPVADVRRRFGRSLRRLFDSYLVLADRWVIWDNRKSPAQPLANSLSASIEDARTVLRHEET